MSERQAVSAPLSPDNDPMGISGNIIVLSKQGKAKLVGDSMTPENLKAFSLHEYAEQAETRLREMVFKFAGEPINIADINALFKLLQATADYLKSYREKSHEAADLWHADREGRHQAEETREAMKRRAEAAEQDWQAIEEKLRTAEAERDEARKDAAFHSDCRPNRREAEAAMADAKAVNDSNADLIREKRELEAALHDARAQVQPFSELPRYEPVLDERGEVEFQLADAGDWVQWSHISNLRAQVLREVDEDFAAQGLDEIGPVRQTLLKHRAESLP